MTGSRRLSCHAFTELQSIANETIKNLFEPGASSSLFEVVERLRFVEMSTLFHVVQRLRKKAGCCVLEGMLVH